MDERRAEETLAHLIALGLVEERADGEILPTRRWAARFQAAAEKLNQRVAATGAQPDGDPYVLAAATGLLDEKVDLPPDLFDDAVRMLVVLERSRRGDRVGAMGYDGFADAG